MKKKRLIPLTLLGLLALTGCSLSKGVNLGGEGNQYYVDTEPTGETSEGGTPSEVTVDETGETPEVNVSGDFSISTSDGNYSNEGSIYRITSAGTYVLQGNLTGQILIEAGEEDEVVLELSGVAISYGLDSPIKALSAGKVEISAKKNKSNSVTDTRSEKTVENESLGEGAISCKCDLKLKGTGVLVVTGGYNNAVHTTKDLKIQKLTLHATAVNNALKGKNSIEMISGDVTAISKKGNGLKTVDTDVSSKGNQKGSVTISGGSLLVDSCFDGIDAAYDLYINEDNEDGLSTKVVVKTGKNSSNSSNYNKDTSAKGLKADNKIEIKAGTVTIAATDDAIHANYGDTFDNGETGVGIINISGGTVGIAAGDDAIHADNSLNISGGEINVTGSYEGLEATHINISGGSTYVYGTDDGVNAAKKINETPSVTVSGGFLDITIATGDTDGIDSNGNFTQTGGLIVTRGGYGSAGNMSTGLDVDGNAQISGGTFIAFNGTEKTPAKGSDVLYAYYGTTGNQGGWGGGSGGGPGGPGGGPGGGGWRAVTSYKFPSGSYTLTGGEMSKTFYNAYDYAAFLIYSNELVLNTTYTLSQGETSILSWTQSSSSQQIS